MGAMLFTTIGNSIAGMARSYRSLARGHHGPPCRLRGPKRAPRPL